MFSVSDALPFSVHEVMRRLESAGFETFVVGGFLRDFFLLCPTHDIDLATSASPDEVFRVLESYPVIPTGLRHGTVTVLVEGRSVEITTFRTEGLYADHRHPDTVLFAGTIEDDLSRRDFTINAMAWNARRGLVDPYDGRGDLDRKVIRTVGNAAQRFNEDALRIMRALRIGSELGFAIDESSAEALEKQRALLRYVAAERVQKELVRLICAPFASSVLQQFSGVLEAVLPEIALLKRLGTYRKALRRLAAVPEDPAMRLAALFYELEFPESRTPEEILRQLRFDKATIDRAVGLIAAKNQEILPERRSVLAALHVFGPDKFFDVLCLRRADAASDSEVSVGDATVSTDVESGGAVTRADASLATAGRIARDILAQDGLLAVSDLAVGGDDVKAAGFRGSEIGEMLERLWARVMLDGLPNTRAALLADLQMAREAKRTSDSR